MTLKVFVGHSTRSWVPSMSQPHYLRRSYTIKSTNWQPQVVFSRFLNWAMHRCVLGKKRHFTSILPCLGQAIYPWWWPSLTKDYTMHRTIARSIVRLHDALVWQTDARHITSGTYEEEITAKRLLFISVLKSCDTTART